MCCQLRLTHHHEGRWMEWMIFNWLIACKISWHIRNSILRKFQSLGLAQILKESKRTNEHGIKWLCFALLTHEAVETSTILHASCNSKGCFAGDTFQMFGTQNARNTTGDRDPTNCTCIIIQSTFSIYKTYNTNAFILYIHRLSFSCSCNCYPQVLGPRYLTWWW